MDQTIEKNGRHTFVAWTRERFERHTGRRPEWAWFAPGRVEIFGKHTDYAGGRSLVAAVSRGFAIIAAPNDTGTVRALDAATGQTTECDPADDARAFTGWRNYVAVVARRLAINFPGADLGADIAFASNLPRAAGVSSSSALVVGIATALARRGGLDARDEWRETIQNPLDLAGYLGAVESGLRFGSLAGTTGVGIHGGSEDHTAILLGRAGLVSAYAYVPVRHLATEAMPSDWRFVIMNTGVHAAKAGSARERYNRASDATRALVSLGAGGHDEPAGTLADLLRSDPEAEAVLRARLAELPDSIGAASLARRLDHFIREDARVLPAAGAFRDADRAALGDLARASQEDADVLLGNQVEETRQATMIAREAGAFAASSFGAGFGGSVWALVEAGEAAAFLTRWQERYARAFPVRRDIDGFVTAPAEGLSELEP